MILHRERRGRSAARAPAGIVLAGALLCAGCGVAPDGSVYFTSGQTDEVVKLHAADGSVEARIGVDRLRFEADEPHALALAPDGRHWYVTVAHGEPSLWKFEADADRLVGRVDLPSGGAAMIGMSPDGALAFVPDYDRVGDREGRVAAIRLRDLAVVGNAAICTSPHDAAVHPTLPLVAIACAGSDELVLTDTELNVRSRIAPPAGDTTTTMSGHMPAGGSRPLSIAWSHDGDVLAVALHNAGRVWLVDRAGTTRGLVAVGAGPAQVAFADERTIVTANRMDGSLSVVDLESGTELRRVALPIPFPHGVAVGGGVAYVACEGTPEVDGGVVAVDIASGRILWQQAAGRYVLAVMYVPRD